MSCVRRIFVFTLVFCVLLSGCVFAVCPRQGAGFGYPVLTGAGYVSLAPFNKFPSAARKASGELPGSRIFRTKFRGTSDAQIDVKKAVRAMLGDESAMLESRYFSGAKLALMKKETPQALDVSDNGFLREKVELSLGTNGGKPYEESVAREITVSIMNDYFLELAPRELERTYLHYLAKDPTTDKFSYVDYPKAIIFTSFCQQPARVFGNRVVIIKEEVPRGVDLNYWNYLREGYLPLHGWTDIGEYIIPGYVPSSDIVGFEVHSGPLENRRPTVGYYSIFHNNKLFVLVVDPEGARSLCREAQSDQVLVCRDPFNKTGFPDFPESTGRQPQAWGVFELTSAPHKCSVSASLRKKYRVLGREIPSRLYNFITQADGLFIGKKKIRFCR